MQNVGVHEIMQNEKGAHKKRYQQPGHIMSYISIYIDDYNYHTMQNDRGPTNFAEPQILIAPLYTSSFWHRILQ